MNKADLVAKVAEKAGLTKKDAEKAINALVASVQEALVKKDKVPKFVLISSALLLGLPLVLKALLSLLII